MATHGSCVSDRRRYSTDKFDRLMAETRFLFRYFDYLRTQSPLKKYNGFLAPKYQSSKKGDIDVAALWAEELARYPSAVEHVNGDRAKSSPWISTTRAWDWAVWWMGLHKKGVTHKAKIAVIDLLLLPQPLLESNLARSSKPHQGIVRHALDLISQAEKQKSPVCAELNLDMLKARANAADEVLVYAKIPLSAIVSTIDLDNLKLSIPAYIEPIAADSWAKRIHNWGGFGR